MTTADLTPDLPAAGPGRLLEHAFAYRLSGLSLVADGHESGRIEERLWSIDELTTEERAFLGRTYDEALALRPCDDGLPVNHRARLYAQVLAAYGIACPHPMYWRNAPRPHAFECLACEQYIVDGAWPRRA